MLQMNGGEIRIIVADDPVFADNGTHYAVCECGHLIDVTNRREVCRTDICGQPDHDVLGALGAHA